MIEAEHQFELNESALGHDEAMEAYSKHGSTFLIHLLEEAGLPNGLA